jgi:hypothetical protein
MPGETAISTDPDHMKTQTLDMREEIHEAAR